MHLLLVVLIMTWLGVAAHERRRGHVPGPAVQVRRRMQRMTGGDPADDDWDPPRSRPTLDHLEGWLALAVLAVLAFVLANATGATAFRGVVLVVGLLLVAARDERATRVRRPRRGWPSRRILGTGKDLPGDLFG